MSDDARTQAYWQQHIIDHVEHPLCPWPETTFRDFWFNPLNRTSLRLTEFGHRIAAGLARLDNFRVDLDSKIKPKHFLLFEKACVSPYYVKKLDQLVVFDQETAVMIQLHAGNFDAYFKNRLNYN